MWKCPKALALVVVVVLAAAFGAGCGSSSKSKGTTTTTRNEGGFEIATPDGQAALSLNGDLPAGWPSDFPIPDNADVAGSGSLNNSSDAAMVAVYTVSGDASDTYDFYKKNTVFTVTSSSSAGFGSAFVGTVEFEGAFTGSATLAGRNAKTYLAIVLKTSTEATTTTGVGETTTTAVPTGSTLAAG